MTTDEPPAEQLPIGYPTAEEISQLLRDDCKKKGLPFRDYSEIVEVSTRHVPSKNGTFWTLVRTRPKVRLVYNHVPEWQRIEKVREICEQWNRYGTNVDPIAPSGYTFNNIVLWSFEGDEVTSCTLRYLA